MTDTVNKKSMVDELHRIKASQQAIKDDLSGSDHHMYWRAVGKLELISYLLSDCAPPTTPVQGYREALRGELEAKDAALDEIARHDPNHDRTTLQMIARDVRNRYRKEDTNA